MGLDMYLTKKTYIGGKYNHRQISGSIDIAKEGERIPISLHRVDYIAEEVAYWCKSNQIHKWFVDNVQNGVDDCKEYSVTVGELQRLVSICQKVLENHELAHELLPTQSGCFFGSINYDDYYYQDLELTVEQLKDIEEERYDVSYYYQSSW